MKRSSRPARTPASLPESVYRQVNMYALAATAAGVSLLACPQDAEGKIVYKRAHVQIIRNQPYSLDLNHDGITDFYLLVGGFVSTRYVGLEFLNLCNHSLMKTTNSAFVCGTGGRGTNAPMAKNPEWPYAAALPSGIPVDKGAIFGTATWGKHMGGVIYQRPPEWLGDWVTTEGASRTAIWV
jgi:hypothetical protein